MRRNPNRDWAQQIITEVDADIAAGRHLPQARTWLDKWTDPVAYSKMAAKWERGELEARLGDVPVETVGQWLRETAEIAQTNGLSAAIHYFVNKMYPLQAEDSSDSCR